MDSNSSPPLVLVTGATGYIATHVVQQLQEQGYRVRGTVRSFHNATKVVPLSKLCPDAKYPLEIMEADLVKADSWPVVLKDCQYVLHIASPLPNNNPRPEDELLQPAVEGTLNVLRACTAAGTIKRVVLTSALATIVSSETVNEDHVYTEADWTDTDNLAWIYAKSKTLAERAAWEYHEQLPEADRFELAVLNPSYVIGPVLCGTASGSMEIPRQLLQREMSMLPHINFPYVDVRDVAAAHVTAMVTPGAAGHRHIVSSGNMWLGEIARILEKEFKPQGYSVPIRVAPYAVLWMFSWFNESVKRLLPIVGTVVEVDNSRMKNVLNVAPREIKDSWIDMCYSMIERGFVKKTSEYTGPRPR